MMVKVRFLVLIAFSVLVLVEGQGQFTQPPSDNHNLPLDSYKAESSFIVPCAYIEVGAISINYAWAKDGVAFQPETSTVGNTRQAILTVPNGDYNSSVEGTYTCSVTVDRAPRGSRNTTVSLPVLFSVNATTVVVTAGEAVTVNCSQTGYIRSQWRWRRNGINIPTSSSERVYTELSARSKVGSFTGNTVDNHQSLFLHLWHARVMDNGVYICVTETDAQNVVVDVQSPDNVRFSDDGPVSYEVPQPFESITESYADFLYSGIEDSEGVLKGGVGQLVDGVKGTEALNTDKGRLPWVGWATPLSQIIFDFGALRQFHAVTVHAFFNSSRVTSFGTVEVSINCDEKWNTFFSEINGIQGPRDVTVTTQIDDGTAVVGRYVRLTFGSFQGSGPMLISEISFDNSIRPGLEQEPNVSCPVLDHELSTLATSLLIVGVLLLGTVLATLAGILVTCCYCRRKKNTKEKSAYTDMVAKYPILEMEKNPAYVGIEKHLPVVTTFN